MKEKIHVVAAVIEEDKRYLIAKRQNDTWEFPGGKIKEGETKNRAIIREITEELDCEINPIQEFHEEMEKDLTITYIRCEITKGMPKAKEHKEIQWVNEEEIKEYNLWQADRLALEKLQSLKDQC